VNGIRFLAITWLLLSIQGFADTAWMRPGIRAWYFGGVGSSNATEAYLINQVTQGEADVIHHTGTGNWSFALPGIHSNHDLNSQGPFWIHPAVLSTLQHGPSTFWQGREVTLVIRTLCTRETLPCVSLLPVHSLFDASPERVIVTVNYMIPNFSVGTAYFDAETGLLLQWNEPGIFFYLAEINYDFLTRTAFPEPDRPHPGFRSMISLTSFDGGMIVIHSTVESAVDKTIATRVKIDETGAGYFGESRSMDLNACFFGEVPILRMIDAADAENRHPLPWDPAGEYLWWWLPPAAHGHPAVTILAGEMDRTIRDPQSVEFTARTSPDGLYLPWARFDKSGYATDLWMADPSIGMSVGPHNAFNPTLTVYGLDYYREEMGAPIPVPSDGFGRDATDLGNGWRHYDWFGTFHVGAAPFIYHLQHGWLIANGYDCSHVDIYDFLMDAHWWTCESLYPYLYRYDNGKWLCYESGLFAQRQFSPLAP
jgi:hypothetical protein